MLGFMKILLIKTIIHTLNILLYWPIATEKDLKIIIVGLPKSMASKRRNAENP